MYVMNAPVPVAAEAVARQKVHPAVTAGGLAKNMHDPNGLLDTRSASPRAPALIAAVCLEGILAKLLWYRNERRKNPMRRTSKNRVPTGKMRMYHPSSNSTKSEVMQVTW